MKRALTPHGTTSTRSAGTCNRFTKSLLVFSESAITRLPRRPDQGGEYLLPHQPADPGPLSRGRRIVDPDLQGLLHAHLRPSIPRKSARIGERPRSSSAHRSTAFPYHLPSEAAFWYTSNNAIAEASQ